MGIQAPLPLNTRSSTLDAHPAVYSPGLPGDAHDPGFGRVIRCRPGPAPEGGPARDVYDRALLTRQQVGTQGTAPLKGFGQVDVYNEAPFVLGHTWGGGPRQLHDRFADGV